MYKFKKININGNVILALEVSKSESVLFNFCTLIRVQYVWKNQVLGGFHPFTPDELNNLKKKYQHSLIAMIYKEGNALVDISNGEILNPSRIHKDQIIGEYECPLPF